MPVQVARITRAQSAGASITSGLASTGGSATKAGKAWRVTWADGSESAQACFDARTADENPELEMDHHGRPARPGGDVIVALCRRTVRPVIRVTGLPDSVRGIWSQISLVAAEGLSRKRFLPVFINEEGRSSRLPSACGICC